MILIGQYDSPFVRRVGIALRRCEVPFEHRPWSVWGNAEQIAEYNPLRRVPTLLLDDGTALVETFAILDALDELVGPARALLPARDGLRIAALAAGICDKSVTLLYSSLDLMAPSPLWKTRCKSQILDTFTRLESERALHKTQYWFGDSLSHADIAVACAIRFTAEAHPELFDPTQFPALSADSAACESLPEFREISLPITNNLTP
jgi:glutathione S-transferase